MKSKLPIIPIIVYYLTNFAYAIIPRHFDEQYTKDGLKASESVNNTHEEPKIPVSFDVKNSTSPVNVLDVVYSSPKEEVSAKLNSYLSRLKSYVNDTGLDRSKILTDSNSLSLELLGIGKFMRSSTLPKSLIGQINFANSLFLAMYDSAVELLPYENLNDSNFLALRKLYDLEMRILPLYNTQGKLNVKVKDYMKTLLDLHRNLIDMGKESRRLKTMPAEMKKLFQSKQRKLRKQLSSLGRQVPVPKNLPGSTVGDFGSLRG